jgi:heme-degrading monooxygenase HmoA
MYVRTIYATGDPAKMDVAVERLTTEGQELLSGQPGFRGMGLFVDRELGKLLVGTWWDSEKNRQASDEKLREPRMAMMQPFAQTAAIDNWEAAVVRPPANRLQPGAGFRLSRLEFAPSDAELLVETFQGTTLPKFEMIPGYEGASLFIDRAAGRATVGVLYTDLKALGASRSANAEIRGESAPKAHVTLRSLEEFEVVTVAVRPT